MTNTTRSSRRITDDVNLTFKVKDFKIKDTEVKVTGVNKVCKNSSLNISVIKT